MFSQSQLDFIKKCAKERKNQGEIAVYELAKQLAADGFLWEGFDERQINVLKFCAEECKRQRSGEMSVYDMVCAWAYASTFIGEPLAVDFIEDIGSIVEPIDNKNGFRTIPIGIQTRNATEHGPVWGWIEKAKWDTIVPKLTRILEAYYEGNLFPRDYGTHPLSENPEDEFYFEYEEVHPFVDGNGRSGKILYNYLKGTLDNPVMPPNFWGSSNP